MQHIRDVISPERLETFREIMRARGGDIDPYRKMRKPTIFHEYRPGPPDIVTHDGIQPSGARGTIRGE